MRRKTASAVRAAPLASRIFEQRRQASTGLPGLWLVSKTVCDRLRAYLLSQGVEGIPDKNTALFNLLQDNAIAQVNGEGKAIWKATVLSQTGWKNTFTFLRLASGLIWSAKERPSMFLGTVTVEHTPLRRHHPPRILP